MFKITCMKCGKETVLTQGKPGIDRNNDNVKIEGSYEFDYSVQCDCGQKIDTYVE